MMRPITAFALLMLSLSAACTLGEIGGDEIGGTEAGLLGVDMELGEVHRPYAPASMLGDALRVVDGQAVLEGDIVLGPLAELETEDTRSPQSVGMASCVALLDGRCVSKYRYLWPKGVVRYQIMSGFSSRKRDQINAALQHWRNKTPLRFVPAKSGTRVKFKPDADSCSSTLGYIPNAKLYIKVSPWCGRGNLIHEIGHAVGLLHEHVRCDRGKYVKIIWTNIDADAKDNFKKRCYTASGNIYGVVRTLYDYGSIMHYGTRAFSRNGKPTIKQLLSGPAIGQRVKLSTKDIRGVKRRYKSVLP